MTDERTYIEFGKCYLALALEEIDDSYMHEDDPEYIRFLDMMAERIQESLELGVFTISVELWDTWVAEVKVKSENDPNFINWITSEL